MTASPAPTLSVVGADRHPSALVIDVPAGTSPEVWQIVERVGATLEELLGAVAEPASATPSASPSSVVPADARVLRSDRLGDNDESAPVYLDAQARSVWRGEDEIHLTHLEFELLAYFVANPRRAINRDELLDNVWHQPGSFGNSRTIDVHIRRLRCKLGRDLELTTVRGFGYRLDGWSAPVRPPAR